MKVIINKIAAILFSTLLLLSSTGILFIHHHCEHCKVDDWHLFSTINCKTDIYQPDCCSKQYVEINSHKKPCCSNEGFFFKVVTYSISIDLNTIQNIFEFENIANNYNLSNTFIINLGYSLSDNSPPLANKPIFILTNSIRI
ncbi:MAG: hypothetical protein A2X08_15725 [Bacteroidetes bacterium GWA2_32_17]|nr:MAG: hypothetical protein A2X08_15725 [Bacteroidetes bacterium GWA2_32_17]